MRWPFVSPAENVATVAQTIANLMADVAAERGRREGVEAVRDQLRIELERADKRYADLLARFTMLRMNGATEPPPARVVEPVAADPVVETINALAPDAKVRGAMLRQVAFDKASGLRPDEIIQRIRRGHRPAEEVA